MKMRTENHIDTETKTVSSGTCGQTIFWELTENGTLTVSGVGSVKSLTEERPVYKEQYPWLSHRGEITGLLVMQGVTEIGERAFYQLDRLESVRIADSVTHIGKRSFYGCRTLREIVLPSGVTSLEERLFANCECLERVEIPKKVKTIRKEAFSGCKALKEISLPQELVSIGSEAFYGCVCLRQITLPSSIRRIGYEAFAGCKGLLSVKVPAALILSEEKEVFSGCASLDTASLVPPPDALQRAMKNLNDELEQFAGDFLDASNSVYGFWFEEVAQPQEIEIKGQVEDTTAYMADCVQDAIWQGLGISDRYTDAVPEEMKNRIMQVLDRYEPRLYELSSQGYELYGEEETWIDVLHCLVRLQGEKTHWYAVWSMWSD